MASTVPLPTELGGTSVMVNGRAAPLFYVSPGQINFQMPSPWLYSNFPTPANIVVSTASGASDPVRLDYAGAPGLFTLDASGCGQGLALNVHSNGTVSVNSPERSVSPGEYISLCGTGLGILANSSPDGMPAPSTPPLAGGSIGPAKLYDFARDTAPPGFFWGGRAPGLIGVDQFNVNVPETVREGCAVPVQVLTGDLASQPVTIAVRKGGGPCVDPPAADYGQITWEKTVIIEPQSSPRETNTLTVSLQASPGKRISFPRTYGLPVAEYLGPSCPLPGYRSLDAGTVAIQGPGFGPTPTFLMPLREGQVSNLNIYQAVLPAGAIQPGSFSVNAAGGTDVGAFESTVRIGSEIRITTELAGRVIPNSSPGLLINWTGGDPNTWVTARLVRHLGYADRWSYGSRVRASEGTIGVPAASRIQGGYGIPGGGYPVELVIEVTPVESPSFSASGLSLGGQHLWKYTYRFQGLVLD
jgi:uncharacterized protein (TIGR03437 family)